MTYKLSVVKASDGNYLVNCYHKREDEKIDSFVGVVNKILEYYKILPKIFEQEPTLRVVDRERKAIEGLVKVIRITLD